MNNECIPLFEAAYTQKITVHCTAAITGRRFVAPLVGGYQGSGPALSADPLPTGDGGNLIVAGPAGNQAAASGVAAWDAPTGGKGVIIRGAGTIVPMECGAAVTLGNNVGSDGSGRAINSAAGVVLGIAQNATTAAGQIVNVLLNF
jgi:hypothetical protein